ncbi:conserved exported hypothetical protein [Tenacibaculum maritimum]|uniref:hypothetical protein n=1 Tax=Tenacibaculum maritimum TaxID=107401 RepID=UPI0012E4BD1D|nr:hypothetical protein [Tenacibaculum maritimum]CAA0237699.1 conserved exported hypothetical protein [Tenacibaculum maritimum]
MKNYLYIIVFLFLYCCQTAHHNSINITLEKSSKQIIIRNNLKEQKLTYFKIPFKIKIRNNTYHKISFKKIKYKYSNNPEESLGLMLFKNNTRISNNLKKNINLNEAIVFESLTRHFIDTSTSIQTKLKPYLKKMLSTNKDTLHIGTVTEFRQKHPKLFQQLTKDDRVSIQFLEGKKLGKPISIPVTW